jgi:hypothetical protein
MPALAPYIPAKDAQLAIWAANFSSLITASPATYGLTSGDASAIASVETAWAADYSAATNNSTRTPQSVAAKNSARVSLLATCRPYAQTITLNAGVSSAAKIALGLNPRTSTPQPITTPTTNPALSISQAMALQHVVRYRDSIASPSVKAKPYGVIGVQIFATASATPITDPTQLTFQRSATKSPVVISWPSLSKGMQAYYSARWQTRTGLVGAYSPIISFTIAG